MKAQAGDQIFLVYGECECGYVWAAPEMSVWPDCPRCEKQILPPDPDTGERLGIFAELQPESDAVDARNKAGR